MAQVFLSYARKDAGKARPIAAAIEKAGHQVWWDRHIEGGTQYARVIEQALAAAQAVVVLWSADSVDSHWVRDEAAAGRDTGRLVPVLLDGTDPPLGFRQYQAVDLSRWRGRGSPPGLAALVNAVGMVASGNERVSAASTKRRSAATQGWRAELLAKPWRLVALAIGLAAVGLGLLISRPWEPAPRGTHTVAVTASDRFSVPLARELRVKLASLQTGKQNSVNLLDEGAAADAADFLIKVNRSTGPSTVKGGVLLLRAKDRAILWSRDFEEPREREGDIHLQLAFTSGRVLACAADALSSRPRLDQQTFKLYLNGCDQFANLQGIYARPVVSIFLEVTRSAPRFARAWASLLVAEAQVASEDRTIVPDLRKHMAQARKLDPDMAEIDYAEIVLSQDQPFVRQLSLSEAAIKKHPDHPLLLGYGAWLLSEVGRMKESIDLALGATENDPLSMRARSDFVAMLAYGGQLDAAYREIAVAEKQWPGSMPTLDARFRIDSRYGDAKRALELQRSGTFGENRALEAFLEARIDPTEAKINRAVATTEAMAGRDPRALGYLIQVWGEHGRTDAIYDALAKWPDRDLAASTLTFFRPPLKEFRRDRRFMQVAKRAGLVDYWRSSGKWPDFCFEPELPYDCKAEAAKLV